MSAIMNDKDAEQHWRNSIEQQTTVGGASTRIGPPSESGHSRCASSATTPPQLLPSPRSNYSGFTRTSEAPLVTIPDGVGLSGPGRRGGGGSGTDCPGDGEVDGWPKLAAIMASIPEFQSFSRFRKLRMKSLLYYHVELAVLENLLAYAEDDDQKAAQNASSYIKRQKINFAEAAEMMVPVVEGKVPRGPDENQSPGEKQWGLVLRIRKTMKEYGEFRAF
jgi:hypothetical protein